MVQPNNIKAFSQAKKYRPAELFQLYRQRAGLNQSQLATALGLKSKRMVQYWEAGDSLPTAPNLKKLLETFARLGVFEVGQEQNVIEQVWATVKASYETQAHHYATYPILDTAWLATLVSSHKLKSELPSKLASPKHNLPHALSSFIGRETQIGQIKKLLVEDWARLLTLTGSGGVGKTRLALKSAAQLLDFYPDGVWLIELAPLTQPALVVQTVASVLGVQQSPGHTLLTNLLDYLRPRKLLLLLDNCEHLIGECARLAETVLSQCERVQVLATSREGLGLSGEVALRVPSLALPDALNLTTDETANAFEAESPEAIRLFMERASLVKSDFELNSFTTRAVGQICRRLDGIPLAIELAAARIKVLAVEQLASRLDDRFRLLTGGSRTALPRQQTLQATIDWSYALLTQPEQLLFKRLAVFTGGWTLEGAEQICAGDGIERYEVLDLLEQLINKSLVIMSVSEGDLPRYHYLETLREYGLEKLPVDEKERLADLHVAYYIELVEELELKLELAEQVKTLARLDMEYPNIETALEWLIATGDSVRGQRLSGALGTFWLKRGYLSQGWHYLGRVLKLASDEATAYRARVLYAMGRLAGWERDHAKARQLLGESVAIYRELGDSDRLAAALNFLGITVARGGDQPLGRQLLGESVAIFRELGNKNGIAFALNNLGHVTRDQGDYPAAWSLFAESLAIRRELGNKGGIGASLQCLGQIAKEQGDYSQARALYEESLAIYRELGSKNWIALSLAFLGGLALKQGDYSQARALYEESLAISREVGDKVWSAVALNGLGDVFKAQGDYATAHMLIEEGLAINREQNSK